MQQITFHSPKDDEREELESNLDAQRRLRRRREAAITLGVLAFLTTGILMWLIDPIALIIYTVVGLVVAAILLAIDYENLS